MALSSHPITLMLGDECVCEDGYVEWVYRVAHQCMYGVTGQLSFVLGCTSIGFWAVTQVPQMVENYRLGKADGLSGWFVLQWAVGDTCNLVGCLLSQQQAATETYTAIFFVLQDVLLGAQYLHYKMRSRKERRLKRKIRESFADAARSEKDHDDDGEGDNKRNVGARAARASSASGHAPTWRSSKAVRYVAAKRENVANGGEAGLSPSSSSVTSVSRPLGAAVTIMAGSVCVMTTTAAAAPLAGRATATVVPAPTWERVGRRRAMMVTATTPASGRALWSRRCDVDPPTNRYFVIAGQALGYVSLACYISSRVAQISRNYKRKSVEGLSTTMFVFAILANLTYGAAILLAGGGQEVVLARLPWLLGSLGTVFLDLFIFAQSVMYGDSPPEYSSASEATTPGGSMSRSESSESTALLIGNRNQQYSFSGDYSRPPPSGTSPAESKPLSAPV